MTAVIASPDDIDLEQAVRAYSGVSMVPERRAEQARVDYAEDVNGFHAELLEIATNDHQRLLVAGLIADYRDGYRMRLAAFHAAYSRVVSTMVAGPSNFPVRQMAKRSESADKRRAEFVEWREKARKAIRKKVLDARSDEHKASEAWDAMRRDLVGSLGTIASIDDGEMPGWDRTSFVSSIVGKVERLAKSGDVATVDLAIEAVRAWNAGRKKPAITSRSKFWGFADVARQAAAVSQTESASDPETVWEGDGARIVVNPAIDRVQIVFDDIPDASLRSRLKSEAWNWSRREGAWQRKRTDAAVASAKRLLQASVTPVN